MLKLRVCAPRFLFERRCADKLGGAKRNERKIYTASARNVDSNLTLSLYPTQLQWSEA
jgi:hypothetical protein